ncbi:MAG: hypothetical protein PHP23_03390 [Desulfobacterales bacterium]|nr:hypothetical protein [Desulfobacterales bacterium]MDD4072196.1 hypothetical protein [Desulfobacterales bacterium]MDD4393077.1 hypothetical protein [Desulfobacterales bacterium]
MYDKELALEIMRQIHQAAQTILQKFEPVKKVSDFTGSPAGMEKLDSICMLLIAIGEALKNLDKTTNKTLLSRYPGKKMRAKAMPTNGKKETRNFNTVSVFIIYLSPSPVPQNQ